MKYIIAVKSGYLLKYFLQKFNFNEFEYSSKGNLKDAEKEVFKILKQYALKHIRDNNII